MWLILLKYIDGSMNFMADTISLVIYSIWHSALTLFRRVVFTIHKRNALPSEVNRRELVPCSHLPSSTPHPKFQDL